MSLDIPTELEKEVDERITHYPVSKRSAVLPVLHALQHHFGFIDEEAIEWTASKLELEPIKVLEVVTFYPGLRQSAPGKYHVRVCRTLSCAMAGSYELMESICEKTGIDRSGVTHHDPIAVSPRTENSVSSSPNASPACGTGPVCLVNDDFHEAVSDVDGLLKQYK